MLFLKHLHSFRIHRQYSSKIRLKSARNELSSMEIRNLFLSYFIEEHNHKFIRSSPVIPFCDPTVPFVNAGMNQFKNIFLGKATPSCNSAANSQKCIRAGGKHNDLSIIGTDGYHHTFFEMLGNWSFGEYFKDKACRLAWDLLINSYNIDSSRLYVTYFGGDTKLGLPPDEECKEIWRSIGVPDNRILPFGSENFWEMGATGPCGTCSEIHIDHLPNSNPMQRAQLVNAGLPDLTELWNVVFIEYNRKSDGTLEPLKEKFIDTGMGFERLVAVLQGKSSNYDTDLFLPIFDAITKESGKTAYSGVYNPLETNYELDYAYRLVADHARMCSVCIADGMYPQTNHRLRKIMRRALNICEQKFQQKNLIHTAVVPKIVESLGLVYPELETHSTSICEIFEYENELLQAAIANNRKNFKLLKLSPTSNIKEDDTVDFSNFLLAYRDVEKRKESNKNLQSLPVEFVYDKLFITYGLTDELIGKLAAEKKLKIDWNQFEVYKNKKKQEAKSHHQLEETPLIEKVMSSNVPPTIYHHMYDYVFEDTSRTFVVKPLKAKVAVIERNEQDDSYHIVMDKTNFYHTAGGQDSDTGQMITDDGIFDVENVSIHKGFVVHSGRFLSGSKPFQSNDEVNLAVNQSHRTYLSQHHTAMHLLQAAMKKVTKRIVFQESSHVSASNLKCQFGAIGKRIPLEQLENIEKLVCQVIQSKVPIRTQNVAAHELYSFNNLTTLPGATYPDNEIRVLKIIDNVNELESIEPCCGTHANNTSELDDFCFMSVKVSNSSSYHITAVAGNLVESIKVNEKNFHQNYEAFKKKIFSDDKDIDDWTAIESEASQIKRQLFDGQIPYITSAKVLSELESLDKHIRTTKRAQIRDAVVSEIIDVLETRSQFLVHVLHTKNPLDDMLLAEAEQMCNDLPVILLNVSDNRIVNGRASIPLKYTDGKFNANRWLQELARIFNMKCSSGKIKNHCTHSALAQTSNQFINPLQLENAIQRTKNLAARMFGKSISTDENNRLIHSFQFRNDINDIRSKLKNVKSIDDVLSIAAFVTNMRNDLKVGLYAYKTKSAYLTELAEINDQIIDTQHDIEKELYNPGLEKVISSATVNKRSYAFHVIHAKHPLHHRTIMRMTDEYRNMSLILIIISGNDVIGRISLPLSYTNGNLTAKELGDEFCIKFNGKNIHHGTRLDASVADFQLRKDLVNDESLNEIFKRVERSILNIV